MLKQHQTAPVTQFSCNYCLHGSTLLVVSKKPFGVKAQIPSPVRGRGRGRLLVTPQLGGGVREGRLTVPQLPRPGHRSACGHFFVE